MPKNPDDDRLLAPAFTLDELVDIMGGDTKIIVDRLPIPFAGRSRADHYLQFLMTEYPTNDQLRDLYILVLDRGGQLTHLMKDWLMLWLGKSPTDKF